MFSAEELAEIFDEDLTESITMDGLPVDIIPGQIYTGPSDYSAVNRHNWEFSAIAATLPVLQPDERPEINGKTWKIENITTASGITNLAVSRRIT